jgi:hypothetical protein
MDNRKLKSGFRRVQLLAVSMLIALPVIYFIVAMLVSPEAGDSSEANRLLFYLLLVVAVTEPALYPLIKRFHMSNLRRGGTKMSAEQLYFTFSIIKMSLVNAIYIYGLVVYLVTQGFWRLLCFYAVGIVWSIIYWPRRERYERFVTGGVEAS